MATSRLLRSFMLWATASPAGLRISHRGIVRRAAGQHGDTEDGCKETGCGTPRETGHRVAFLNSATVSTWWVVG